MALTKLLKQRLWHEFFEAGVFIKAFNSVWQLLGGIFLLTRLHSVVIFIIVYVSRSQLLGDPEDLLPRAAHLQALHLSNDSTRIFVGLYLLFHGIMNAFLAYNLFRNRLWAYPTMIAFVSIFFVYQMYRLTHTHSLLLLAITIFDVFFIILTYHEWQSQKNRART